MAERGARAWLLVALALASCRASPASLSGPYRSNWGLCVVEVRGEEAAIAYPRGSMRCQIAGQRLSCSWQSEQARGKASFEAHAGDRTLRGTWGHGDSDRDGGEWVMAR